MGTWIASIGSADTGLNSSGNPNSATSIVLTLTHGVAVGNTVLMAVMCGNAQPVTSIVDNRSNTWTLDVQCLSSTISSYAQIWRMNCTNGMAVGDTITLTFAATSNWHMAVAELYSGKLVLDQTATCTPATSTAATTAASNGLAQSNELVFSCVNLGGSAIRPTFTAGNSFTIRQSDTQSNVNTTSGRDVYSMDKDVSSANAVTASGTLSISKPWNIVEATYYVAGSGGSTQTIKAGFAGPATPAAGAKNIGFGLRVAAPDITAAAGTYPWANCVSMLDFWSNIETADNTFTWSQFDVSFKYAIDNGIQCGIRIEMARDGAPSWIYGSNSIGAVQSLITYPNGDTSSPTKTPVPWDANLRKLGKRLLTKLQAYLNTSYNGKTYRDVCAFVSVSTPTALEGTEMTIGDEGSNANTANWNGVLNGQTARQNAYGQAWINATIDAFAALSKVNISVASGTVWGDGRAQFMALCDYMAAHLTASQLSRLIVGPTDMRVDQPGANSYAAWSPAADTAMMHALSLGIRNWAQSAGWSWWSQVFNGGTLAAIQTAYLTDAVQTYEVCLMESNTQILGNVNGLPTWCQNALQPAITSQQTTTTTTGYAGEYGADGGGGFTESLALDDQTVGQYALGADTWGMRVSVDHGNDWLGSMSGLPQMNNPPHARATFFSKRAATAGLRFYGCGFDGSGGGFYYGLPGTQQVFQIGTLQFNIGGSFSSTHPNNINHEARRPCGQLIDSYVNGSDHEAIFTATIAGVNMFVNNDTTGSGVAGKAANIPGTPTLILSTTDIGSKPRQFLEVLDATRMVIINSDHDNAGDNPTTTDVYLAYTTATDWTGATAANTHVLGPLAITPPKGRVYEIHRGRSGTLRAAAGYDGAYTVTLTGSAGTSALSWSTLSMPADVIACSIDDDAAGNVYVGQCAGTSSPDYSNSGTGMPVGHSVAKRTAAGVWSWPASGAAINYTEFQAGDTTAGTGRVWWLKGNPVELSDIAHDVSMIRVDKFDNNRIVLVGRAGCWQSRDAGASWYPAMRGMNGAQTIGAPAQPLIRATGGTNVVAYNDDYHCSQSTDDYETCVQLASYPTGSGGTAVTLTPGATFSHTGLDGNTYVLTTPTSSAPAKMTQQVPGGKPVQISDAAFEGAIVSPVAFTATSDGTVCVSQNGGGIFCLRPGGIVVVTQTAGAQAYGANLAYSGGLSQSIHADFAANPPAAYGPSFGSGAQTLFPGTAVG